ncbi:hypothetical protein KsCSTR_45370 [Candidatus Kuenenia stuttgartiensis]|uniref:Uncharacterized protein n=1 Tax=Kuenenia stuttgartiensis TaxID=174633 RepID=A0A6G7GWG4_KUEST|nr:hypothetical protein KsCSTR_45370 [Candidatus Kuenenia stuttgartiensis]
MSLRARPQVAARHAFAATWERAFLIVTGKQCHTGSDFTIRYGEHQAAILYCSGKSGRRSWK